MKNNREGISDVYEHHCSIYLSVFIHTQVWKNIGAKSDTNCVSWDVKVSKVRRMSTLGCTLLNSQLWLHSCKLWMNGARTCSTLASETNNIRGHSWARLLKICSTDICKGAAPQALYKFVSLCHSLYSASYLFAVLLTEYCTTPSAAKRNKFPRQFRFSLR
jgi:hypothetical protein